MPARVLLGAVAACLLTAGCGGSSEQAGTAIPTQPATPTAQGTAIARSSATASATPSIAPATLSATSSATLDAVATPVVYRNGPARAGVYAATPLRVPPVERWRRDLGPEETTELLCFDDWLLVGSRLGALSLLDATTGEDIWVEQLGAPLIAPPAVAGDIVIDATPRGGGVAGLEFASGAELWRYPLAGNAWHDPLVVGDLAVMLTDDRLVALDVASGAERWTAPLVKGDLFARLVADETRVYAGVDDILYALDLERRATVDVPAGWGLVEPGARQWGAVRRHARRWSMRSTRRAARPSRNSSPPNARTTKPTGPPPRWRMMSSTSATPATFFTPSTRGRGASSGTSRPKIGPRPTPS